jgi:iron complex outermembrane receptor protein
MTPRVAALWRMRPKHQLFAALSGGLEAPAFNEVDPPAPYDTLTGLSPFLKPARSWTWELGARGTALSRAGAETRAGAGAAMQAGAPGGGRNESSAKAAGADGGLAHARQDPSLAYECAVYWIELRDDIVPHDGGAYYFMAGKSRRRGIEVALRGSPGFGLNARCAASFSRNEALRYENELGVFDGNDTAGIPGRTVTATVSYAAPAGLGLEWTGRHVGPYFADDANTARVPAYLLHDLTASWRGRASGVALEAFVAVQNAGDALYVSSIWVNGSEGRFYEPGLPRNWVAGLRAGL